VPAAGAKQVASQHERHHTDPTAAGVAAADADAAKGADVGSRKGLKCSEVPGSTKAGRQHRSTEQQEQQQQ
jgi:hypothetical protein